MEQILNEPILQNLLSTIPPKDHMHTIRELLLIGVNMVSGAIHGNRLKNGSKNQSNYQFINQENHQYNLNSQSQYRNVLDQINKIKSKINHIANYITGTQTKFNQENQYDRYDSGDHNNRQNNNKGNTNKGNTNKGNNNKGKNNKDNNNKDSDNKGNNNKDNDNRRDDNRENDQKRQTSYPTDSRQSSNNKGNNQQRQQNQKGKMKGNFIADGQSLQPINMIDGNRAMIPTKDKASVTPKVTQTVVNTVKTSSNQRSERKPNGRRHLDDTQLKSIMAYPQSPPNRKQKQDKNKDKNQSINLKYNYQQPQLSHNYSNNKSHKITEYQNNDIEKPSQIGNQNLIKSKIKSLVDRDKQRYYYNHSPNNKRDVQVQIYQIPEKIKNQQNRRNNKNQSDKEQSDKDYQGKDEEYSSYRFDQDQHHEQSQEQQSPPKVQQKKPREKEINNQSKTATFKKGNQKAATPLPQTGSPQHAQPQRNISNTEEQQPENVIDGQSVSSSFSQFSLGSSGERQIGKISRRRDKQE